MKVAEIAISFGGRFGDNGNRAVVMFDTVEGANSEFDRLEALLKRREERANDLEKTVTVSCINKFTCPINEITSIGLVDFARVNEQEKGVKDAFPLLPFSS